jgi:serine/threonine protein phosphatase PrpC
MQVKGFGATDVGRRREHNEDSFFSDDDLGLYMVCDGIGGQAAGEVASRTAVEVISRMLSEARATWEQAADEQASLDALSMAMQQAIQSACLEIHEMARSRREYYGMGTTATVLVLHGSHGVMGHVGDSRLYLLRGDAIHQLSQDHTFVQELLRSGVLKPAQAENHPYSNVLTRSLGKDRSVHVDTLIIDVMSDDQFLLCSDGLTKHIEDEEELSQMIKDDTKGEEIVSELIRLANDRGGSDNITVVLARPQLDSNDDVIASRVQAVKDRLAAIQSVPIFRDFSMEHLSRVLYLSTEATYKTDDMIIEQDSTSHGLAIVLEGHVLVMRDDTPLAQLGPGSHFGEMSCIYRRPAAASVWADSQQCRCLWIPYDELEMLIQNKPRLGLLLMRNLGEQLCERLDAANEQMVELQPTTVVDMDPGVWF